MRMREWLPELGTILFDLIGLAPALALTAAFAALGAEPHIVLGMGLTFVSAYMVGRRHGHVGGHQCAARVFMRERSASTELAEKLTEKREALDMQLAALEEYNASLDRRAESLNAYEAKVEKTWKGYLAEMEKIEQELAGGSPEPAEVDPN
jgi:hypothetical protein